MSLPVPVITYISFLLLLEVPNATTSKPETSAGWKITSRQVLGTKSFDTTQYLSGNLSRRETQPFSGEVYGHRRAIIQQRGADKIQVFDLDLDAREYVAYETTVQGTSRSSAKPRQMRPTGATVQLFSDSVDTGETKELFGHVARHIVTKVRQVADPAACTSSFESDTDGWYIDYDALPESWRPRKNAFYHLVSFSTCADTFDKFEVHRSGPIPGYPLVMTTTTRSEQRMPDGATMKNTSSSRMEVVEFTQAPLDPGLFQVPPGFRKVHRLADQIGVQSPAQALWQWVKDTWDDLFD